jgi:hypothetical protein
MPAEQKERLEAYLTGDGMIVGPGSHQGKQYQWRWR